MNPAATTDEVHTHGEVVHVSRAHLHALLSHLRDAGIDARITQQRSLADIGAEIYERLTGRVGPDDI